MWRIPLPGHYLEVSTPIDRPLTRLQDFERFAGLMARVEMQTDYETGILLRPALKDALKVLMAGQF